MVSCITDCCQFTDMCFSYRVLIFAALMFLIAGCMLLYVHCERLYETMAVVRFYESPPQRLLSMAKDAKGLIRPKVKFYSSKLPRSIAECEEGKGGYKSGIYSIDLPIRSSSAVASLALSSARRGSFASIMGASSKSSPGSDDCFDADSSHVTSQEKKRQSMSAIMPLTPAYQSSDAIKISRMPLALFSYLHDDVLVLPPGFLNENSKS